MALIGNPRILKDDMISASTLNNPFAIVGDLAELIELNILLVKYFDPIISHILKSPYSHKLLILLSPIFSLHSSYRISQTVVLRLNKSS